MAAPRGRDHERIGPFLATFSRVDANPYLNYAIPDDGAGPSRADIDALIDAYRRRERRPRLEYVPSLAPAVEPELVAAGFAVEGRLPLMTFVGGTDAPPPDGVELVEADSEEDLRGVASVQWEAYGESGAVPQRAVDGLRRTLEAGGLVVLARDSETATTACS